MIRIGSDGGKSGYVFYCILRITIAPIMARKQTTEATEMPEEITHTFEQAYKELEAIVMQLEQGDLPLEQSIALHTRGQKLATFCNKTLEEAELKVRQIDTE